jgi:hypothetical protein
MWQCVYPLGSGGAADGMTTSVLPTAYDFSSKYAFKSLLM